MIKLLDILKEVNQSNTVHWREHIKDIIACAKKMLASNDPDIVANEANSIIKHAEMAKDKILTTTHKAGVPTFVNSSIANSYSGDDSDINAFQNQRI